jgi:hypothetical protein
MARLLHCGVSERTCFVALLPQLDQLSHLLAQTLVVTVKAVIPAKQTHSGNARKLSCCTLSLHQIQQKALT